jgi:hypothetical protein
MYTTTFKQKKTKVSNRSICKIYNELKDKFVSRRKEYIKLTTKEDKIEKEE